MGKDKYIYDMNGTKIKLIRPIQLEKKYISETYGITGIIDAIIECELEENGVTRVCKIPFELKTGTNEKSGYLTQVILYNLMMKERDELDHKFGILFYSNLEIDAIVTQNNSVRIYNVLELRNHAISLAKNVKESVTDLMDFNVAERTANTHECRYCHIKSFCISV